MAGEPQMTALFTFFVYLRDCKYDMISRNGALNVKK